MSKMHMFVLSTLILFLVAMLCRALVQWWTSPAETKNEPIDYLKMIFYTLGSIWLTSHTVNMLRWWLPWCYSLTQQPQCGPPRRRRVVIEEETHTDYNLGADEVMERVHTLEERMHEVEGHQYRRRSVPSQSSTGATWGSRSSSDSSSAPTP